MFGRGLGKGDNVRQLDRCMNTGYGWIRPGQKLTCKADGRQVQPSGQTHMEELHTGARTSELADLVVGGLQQSSRINVSLIWSLM